MSRPTKTSPAKAEAESPPRVPKRHPNRRGNRLFLDEEKIKLICAAIGLGCPMRTAAANIGCTTTTIYRHARRHPEFADALGHARAQGEIKLVSLVEQSGRKGEWRAAAWLLAHCHRGQYEDRRTEGLTAPQLSAVISQFVDVLTKEIRNAEDRLRVRLRFDDLTASLNSAAAVARPLEHDE